MRVSVAVILWLSVVVPAQAMDLNSYRMKNGRPPLRVDFSLVGLASVHAADLARRGALDHAGFLQQRARLGANAENVSYGCGDEDCAILQWARSALLGDGIGRRGASRTDGPRPRPRISGAGHVLASKSLA
jgi:hypothetical protein